MIRWHLVNPLPTPQKVRLHMNRPLVRVSLIAAIVAGLVLMVPPASAATETLDQSTLTGPVSDGWVVVSSTQSVGGEFTAGLSGVLSRLDVRIQRIGTPTNLTASIYRVDGSGYPTGGALATQAVNFTGIPVNPDSAIATVNFTTAARITQGVRYAFVLSSTDSGANAFGVKFTTTTFTNIAGLRTPLPGPTWARDAANPPLFATYVSPALLASPTVLSVVAGATGAVTISSTDPALPNGTAVTAVSATTAAATVASPVNAAGGNAAFTITGVAAGTSNITFTATGYADVVVAVTVTTPVLVASPTVLSVVAGATGAVTISSTDLALPNGTAVTAVSATTAAATVASPVNAAGGNAAFTITGVAAGTTDITFSATGYADVVVAVTVTAPAPAPATPVTATPAPAAPTTLVIPAPAPVVPVELRPAEFMLGLTPSQVKGLSKVTLAALSPAAFAVMSPAQVKALAPDQVGGLSATQIRAIPADSLRAMKPATLNRFSVTQIRALTNAQASALRENQINALGPVKRKIVDSKR
jgi:hypothetical protein